jgi:hypothetical protein
MRYEYEPSTDSREAAQLEEKYEIWIACLFVTCALWHISPNRLCADTPCNASCCRESAHWVGIWGHAIAS